MWQDNRYQNKWDTPYLRRSDEDFNRNLPYERFSERESSTYQRPTGGESSWNRFSKLEDSMRRTSEYESGSNTYTYQRPTNRDSDSGWNRGISENQNTYHRPAGSESSWNSSGGRPSVNESGWNRADRRSPVRESSWSSSSRRSPVNESGWSRRDRSPVRESGWNDSSRRSIENEPGWSRPDRRSPVRESGRRSPENAAGWNSFTSRAPVTESSWGSSIDNSLVKEPGWTSSTGRTPVNESRWNSSVDRHSINESGWASSTGSFPVTETTRTADKPPIKKSDWNNSDDRFPVKESTWNSSTGRSPAKDSEWNSFSRRPPENESSWNSSTGKSPIKDPGSNITGKISEDNGAKRPGDSWMYPQQSKFAHTEEYQEEEEVPPFEAEVPEEYPEEYPEEEPESLETEFEEEEYPNPASGHENLFQPQPPQFPQRFRQPFPRPPFNNWRPNLRFPGNRPQMPPTFNTKTMGRFENTPMTMMSHQFLVHRGVEDNRKLFTCGNENIKKPPGPPPNMCNKYGLSRNIMNNMTVNERFAKLIEIMKENESRFVDKPLGALDSACKFTYMKITWKTEQNPDLVTSNSCLSLGDVLMVDEKNHPFKKKMKPELYTKTLSILRHEKFMVTQREDGSYCAWAGNLKCTPSCPLKETVVAPAVVPPKCISGDVSYSKWTASLKTSPSSTPKATVVAPTTTPSKSGTPGKPTPASPAETKPQVGADLGSVVPVMKPPASRVPLALLRRSKDGGKPLKIPAYIIKKNYQDTANKLKHQFHNMAKLVNYEVKKSTDFVTVLDTCAIKNTLSPCAVNETPFWDKNDLTYVCKLYFSGVFCGEGKNLRKQDARKEAYQEAWILFQQPYLKINVGMETLEMVSSLTPMEGGFPCNVPDNVPEVVQEETQVVSREQTIEGIILMSDLGTRRDANPLSVFQHSANYNHISHNYNVSTVITDEGPKMKCEVILGGQFYGEALGDTALKAKIEAAAVAFKNLQRLNYTIQMKKFVCTEQGKISKDTLFDTTGIMDTQQVSMHDLRHEDFQQAASKIISMYNVSGSCCDLAFSSELNKKERTTVEKIARKYNMHINYRGGRGIHRYIVIRKRYTPQQLLEQLMKSGGSNKKYELIPPKGDN